MKKTRTEIINYINDLKYYEGYVQFSHRPIDKTKDIFVDTDPKVEDESGFIYEAHFYNAKKSISIKQINDSWLVDETDISKIADNDIKIYLTDIKEFYKIKMAQIWKEESDEFCENMKVKKLKKVVFIGFEKGESE